MAESLFHTLHLADQQFQNFVLKGPLWALLPLLLACGLVTGKLLAAWIDRMAAAWAPPDDAGAAGATPPTRQRGAWFVILGTGLLFPLFTWAVARGDCQAIPEGGHSDWIHWRILYHLTLLSLLIAATGIDFKLYLIPDSITLPGMLIGVLGAAAVGNLQLLPLWVDWNDPLVNLHGPYIPDWIKLHWHTHGLAWSLIGLLAGGGITWFVRGISSAILGQEALGFGDVTLMAMIGSFIGWQPVVLVFALAPLCGLCVGLLVALSTGRTFVAFGPYLSAAALLVLFTWRWLWTPGRTLFGHVPTLLMLAALTCGALVGLLGLLRIYRMIPVKPRA
jgi:leader peptidase (prepilin peptidase)/N-methyltransferase